MSIMEQFGYPSVETARRDLFAVMKSHGISYLEASYSGGNDEGGVDEVTVMKDDRGKTITIEGLGWDHPIQEKCDRMLSTEYGSWAGEWSAYGILYADVKEGKVWRNGEMSSYSEDGATY